MPIIYSTGYLREMSRRLLVKHPDRVIILKNSVMCYAFDASARAIYRAWPLLLPRDRITLAAADIQKTIDRLVARGLSVALCDLDEPPSNEYLGRSLYAPTEPNEPTRVERKAVMDHLAIAARWWADQLRQCASHDTHGGKADRDAALNSLALALMTPAPLEDAQVAAFERALYAVIQREYHAHNRLTLSVDYSPDPLLSEAAALVGIDIDLRLPAKTIMWVEESSVAVARGYGAQPVTLCIIPSD